MERHDAAPFEGPPLEHAPGSAGRLKWEGPFPSGLTVRFDEG